MVPLPSWTLTTNFVHLRAPRRSDERPRLSAREVGIALLLVAAAALCFSGIARADSPCTSGGDHQLACWGDDESPLLAIGAATDVTSNSARLNGSITPRDFPAEAWFEYWPANDPASAVSTPVQTVPIGSSSQGIFADVVGLSPGTAYDFRLAATNDWSAQPARSDTASFTTASPPAPVTQGLAPPTAGQTVNVEPVDGTVGTKCEGDDGFVKLEGAKQIPVGCTVDTQFGTVALTASKGSSGETQTGDFWGGVFIVDQKAGDDQNAVLTLAGRLKCEKRKGGMAANRRGTGGQVLKRRRRGGRRLWGSGKGNFQTAGNYGSASVRGTTWLVVDRCDNSTLTKVIEGTVWVRDFVRGTSIVLNTGEQYLAKAPIPRLR
jgi:hypothetical protein